MTIRSARASGNIPPVDLVTYEVGEEGTQETLTQHEELYNPTPLYRRTASRSRRSFSFGSTRPRRSRSRSCSSERRRQHNHGRTIDNYDVWIVNSESNINSMNEQSGPPHSTCYKDPSQRAPVIILRASSKEIDEKQQNISKKNRTIDREGLQIINPAPSSNQRPRTPLPFTAEIVSRRTSSFNTENGPCSRNNALPNNSRKRPVFCRHSSFGNLFQSSSSVGRQKDHNSSTNSLNSMDLSTQSRRKQTKTKQHKNTRWRPVRRQSLREMQKNKKQNTKCRKQQTYPSQQEQEEDKNSLEAKQNENEESVCREITQTQNHSPDTVNAANIQNKKFTSSMNDFMSSIRKQSNELVPSFITIVKDLDCRDCSAMNVQDDYMDSDNKNREKDGKINDNDLGQNGNVPERSSENEEKELLQGNTALNEKKQTLGRKMESRSHFNNDSNYNSKAKHEISNSTKKCITEENMRRLQSKYDTTDKCSTSTGSGDSKAALGCRRRPPLFNSVRDTSLDRKVVGKEDQYGTEGSENRTRNSNNSVLDAAGEDDDENENENDVPGIKKIAVPETAATGDGPVSAVEEEKQVKKTTLYFLGMAAKQFAAEMSEWMPRCTSPFSTTKRGNSTKATKKAAVSPQPKGQPETIKRTGTQSSSSSSGGSFGSGGYHTSCNTGSVILGCGH